MSRNTRHIPLVLAALLAPACVEEVTVPEPEPAVEAELGDERQVQLRFLRLDAKDFVQELSLEDIKERFPEKILRETWLLDMDLEPLIRNALLTLIATPEADVPQLPRSAQNMWKLLNMTAKSTSLDGTSLAPLIGVGEAVGLGPATILADLIAVDPNEPIITVDLTTRAVIDNVVSSHPNAQHRPGPVDAEHPDGKYPVAPGSLPVSLWDVVTDFAEMPLRFGPADAGEPAHPGFIGGEFKFKATTPDFKMVVKVDLNALPYKGLDLTDGTVANVNSTKSQILSAFDFTSDDWMAIEGLVPALVVEEMTMTIAEDPAFVASGASQTPAPLGDSPVWDLPRWLFERLIAEVAVARAAAIPAHCSAYGPKGQVDPPFIAVQACIGQGAFDGDAFDPEAEAPEHWTSIAVDDSVVLDSPPPPPSYFWDVLLEVAQVRLHDGGLAEGEGDITFTLKDVPVGTTVDQLVSQIKGNIQKNPAALSAIAELLNENTEGRADFYYYVPKLDNPPELQGDWLYFVTAADIENDEDGAPVRPYGYKKPGFFRDAALKDKASEVIAIDGDTSHEKVKIAEGDVLYLLDDEQRLFKLVVDAKPAPHSVALTVTRAR
ncbi:acetyltransferase [Nannocystis pusilla]|uniref:Acetyltransferase n=1 Tax=Nannocystis pusilla TaxID=889268 RepID=A0ABS7TYT0_9BACT|nr:acetyltransferase [Nannocystis pusilla]MBZ5713359.1 acetyltransferase [Nannocystis pusilla]